MIIVGTSSRPEAGDAKDLRNFFQKFLYLPPPDYASRVMLWHHFIRERLEQVGGGGGDIRRTRRPAATRVFCCRRRRPDSRLLAFDGIRIQRNSELGHCMLGGSYASN